MSVAVLPPPVPVDALVRKRFTRDEYQQMLDSGIFAGQRLELIDGELIDKMGQNPPHAATLRQVLLLLAEIFGLNLVLGQSPVEVATRDSKSNFPEPDLSVLREWKQDFFVRHPRGDELLLAVEIADSTLASDTTTKLGLYARAGVPEYWVVDLNGRCVIVHRALVSGVYTKVLTLSEAESVELNGHSVAVARLLP
jgi:Uma2 family endonuclease